MGSIRLRAAALLLLLAPAAAPSTVRRGDPPTPALVRGAWIRALRAEGAVAAERAIEEGLALLPEADRAAFDVDRRLLGKAKEALASLATLVPAGQKLPPALGKTTRLRGEVLAHDAEGFTLKEPRAERRVRWAELALRDVADFLGAREPKGARNLLAAAALRLLDGDAERGAKALQQVRTAYAAEPEAALAGEVLERRAAFEAGLQEAKALAAFRSIPDDAAGEALLAAAKAAFGDAEVLGSEAYRQWRGRIAPRVATALEADFSREGVKGCFRGTVETGEGGLVRLRYGFERAEEASDWVLAPYPAIDAGPWEDLSPKVDKSKVMDWTVKEGGFFAAGQASARHVARFVGDVAVKMSFKPGVLAKGPANEAVIYLFLAGILDDGQGTFVASQGGTNLVRLKKGQLAHLATTGPPAAVAAFGKIASLALTWKEKKLSAALGEKTSMEAPFAEGTGGAVFLWHEGPVQIRVDDLVIEGTLDPAWVEGAKKEWVAKRLGDALPEPGAAPAPPPAKGAARAAPPR